MSFLDSTGVATLTADIKEITDITYPANAAIINGYNSSSAYSVGDFCIYNGLFYKCNTAIASGGETWNSSHWTQTNVTSEWGTKMVVLSYGHNTWDDFLAAFNANAIVYCKASSNSDPGSGSQGRMAFMAFVNYSSNTPTSVEFQYYRSVSSHSANQQGDQVYIYKLESTNGGKWTVTTREAATKIVAGTGLSSSYASGVLTLASDGTVHGIPSGGSSGQILQKSSSTDYATEWASITNRGATTQIHDWTYGTLYIKVDNNLKLAWITLVGKSTSSESQSQVTVDISSYCDVDGHWDQGTRRGGIISVRSYDETSDPNTVFVIIPKSVSYDAGTIIIPIL